jgi:dipeptidyl aminopeptidase/acylaminoacyl peptidase
MQQFVEEVTSPRGPRRLGAGSSDELLVLRPHHGPGAPPVPALPHLDPARLAPVTPIAVTACDGLDLPCHLTLPFGIEHRELPTVLLVHGGPWYRDSWGYDPEVQLLANRGYAVLQVNMRGSTGYGKAFTQAAIGQFAGRMHDDLIDALDWAVVQGYTDPDRVAIYGSSYGGYAALVGAAFTPDRFAAAISYTGMSDLVDLVRSVVPFARRSVENNYLRYIGDPADPRQEADMLARSPVSRVDDITAPVLLIHGANDVRVAPPATPSASSRRSAPAAPRSSTC